MDNRHIGGCYCNTINKYVFTVHSSARDYSGPVEFDGINTFRDIKEAYE